MATCASCHQPLPDGARFCPACGHEVNRGAPEERRVVTVVFADLVGYTALSEHLDPERVKRLIDAAFERLIGDINAFGGRVDKILGDGILALFGAPVAHEDDADRAIRAAINMHETLVRYINDQSDLAASLQLRIGVNTGEVLVGAITGTADYTAMGDVVNVASRLEALAKPGEILIGDATAELASDEILLELVDELAVRGREQPERVWRVTGRQRRVPMSTRDDVPFVGRTAQRELLASIMAMVAGGRSAVVSVSGEAGSGKSRLVEESLAAFPSRAVVIFAGICAPYGETNVWSPIATALFRKLDIQPGIPAATLRDLLISKGMDLYGFGRDDSMLQRFVSGAMHLLGYPSDLDLLTPAQSRETIFALIVESLRRRTSAGPIVLWLDDMQWADVLIVDLLRRIARSLVDRPVLVITAQRDGADLDWPPAFEQPMTVSMPLDPLERDEATQLITAVFGGRVPQATSDQLFERSGGNPLFLTELAELAKEQPSSRELPGSLRALIASRLDQLPLGQRCIVDNAAVLGPSGLVESLHKFAEEMHQRFDPNDLDALVEDGLLEIEADRWRFRSDVVREVAYQTLTKLVRAQRHAGTAAVMAKTPAVMPLETVAHHAAAAAELVAEVGPVPGVDRDIAEQASFLLRDAAQRSLDVGAFNHARRHATRALELGVHEAVLHRELLLIRAQAQTERRIAETARLDATAVLDAAVIAGDRRHEGVARRLLGILDQRDGDLPAARRELGMSVEIFRELGDDIELASSLRERGFAEVFGGSLEDAEWLLGEAEALSDRLDDRRGRAWVRQHQAWAAFLSGNTVLAETRLMAAAQEFDLLGDRAGRGWALGLLAFVRFYQHRFEEAEKLATKVRAESVALGDRWAPAMMDALIAAIRLWTTRFAEADVLSRKALSGFRELGDPFGMILAYGPHLRSLIALGQSYDAERGMEEALAISERFGDLSLPALTVAGAAVHLGVGPRAVAISEVAVERGLRMGSDASESKVTLAMALCQTGRPDEALAVVESVERLSPYRGAVAALASAMTGDTERAIASFEQLSAVGTPTYLDEIVATIAAAAAAKHLGDDATATSRLDAARQRAAEATDQVAIELVEAVSSALCVGDASPSQHPLSVGWRTVVDGLSAVNATPIVAAVEPLPQT